MGNIASIVLTYRNYIEIRKLSGSIIPKDLTKKRSKYERSTCFFNNSKRSLHLRSSNMRFKYV